MNVRFVRSDPVAFPLATLAPPPQVLLRLLPPLGLGPYATEQEVEDLAASLDVPLLGGRLHFHRTAFELVKRCSQVGWGRVERGP